jgi:fermentation-respiration switch protein FrsA (DUF1100 family)
MKILLVIVISVIAFGLFLRLMENRIVFYPVKYPAGYWQPRNFGVSVEDCWFTADDGVRLHGWLMRHEEAIATMIWCHGNAGNISGRIDNLAKLKALPINVFIFDFRGYGRSEGSPTEDGVYLDALAAYDYLVNQAGIASEQIVIFGRSLGGAVAVELATQRQCRALILESTFSAAADMAKSMFGFLPVQLIMKTRMNSLTKITNINVPLLMLHGDRDSIVPYRFGRKLFEAANEPKEFYTITGADHNDTYIVGGKPYFDKLDEFIRLAVRD